MTENSERIVRLEEKVDAIVLRTDFQDERIKDLNKDLVEGLKSQESLLREMVKELKGQQEEMHIAYERMGAFTKGVLWIGGIGMTVAAFLLRYGDKLKAFLS